MKMKKIPWFLNPVLIFVGSLIAIIISLILFIYWSLRTKFGIENFIEKFHLTPDPLLELNTWVTIFTLSILVVVIIVGVSIIYIYYQKSYNLYRLQNNFINNFTHELKTPLTSINLFLETLQGHEVKREDQLTYLGYMKDDASRLWNIINHILSTAKIESNSYQKNMTKLELISLIKQLVDENNQLKNKLNIQYEGHEEYFFFGDRDLLIMLLNNIFTNAIKYNEAEQKTLMIKINKTNSHLRVQFIDNGIGLMRADTKKIFKKFYQVGDSLNTSAKGSGLGLFLSQTIAQLHKFKLVAESSGLGKGSVFILECPLKLELGRNK